MNSAFSMRLAFRAQWIMAIACLAIVASGIVYHLVVTHRAVERIERTHLGNLSQVAADIIGRRLVGTRSMILQVEGELAEGLPAGDELRDLSRQIDRLVIVGHGTSILMLLDAEGRVQAANRKDLLGQNFSHRHYFQAARDAVDASLCILSPPFQTVFGEYTFTLSRKVLDRDGRFVGVVMATMDTPFIGSLLGATLYVPDMWAALAHGNGVQILSVPAESAAGGRELNRAGSYFQQHRERGIADSVIDDVIKPGVPQLVSVRTVEPREARFDQPLVVAVGRDLNAVFADWRMQLYLLSGLYLVGAAITLAGLRIYQRRASDAWKTIARQQALVHTATDGIHVIDRNGLLVDANRAFLDMLGLDKSAIGRLHVTDFDVAKSATEILEGMARLQAEQGSMIIETRHRRSNGTVLDVELSIRAFECEGESMMIASARDITQRKQVEAELAAYRDRLEEKVAARTAELTEVNRHLDLARREAEAATQSKAAFLASMSHEIRTPMNGVIGLLHILRRTGLTAVQSDHVDKIALSAQHLLTVINDILDLSKIEAGKLVLEAIPVAVDQLVGNVLSMVKATANAKKLRLQVDTDVLPPHLLGDPTRLTQALLNYVSNAIKFTEHGVVTLRTKLIEETPKDVLLRFEVADTGIGIAAERLAGLFRPFEQGERSLTRMYGGTGLGLAITRQLASLMGGEVGADSRPGEGSTFWFSARLTKGGGAGLSGERLHNGESEAQLQAHFAGRRVLLVEDEPVNQEIGVMLLEGAGLDVTVADNGELAVDCLKNGKFDLVLMDMQMPVLDGLEATRRLRRLPGCEALPVVAMTANAFAEDRQRCMDAGMDDFIGKPVDPEYLFRVVLYWLGRGSA